MWRLDHSHRQIFPQFSTSYSPKVLEAGMSPKRGELNAHSWDFVSPESDNDGERGWPLIGDGGGRSSILKRRGRWLLLMGLVSQPPEFPRFLPVSQAWSFMPSLPTIQFYSMSLPSLLNSLLVLAAQIIYLAFIQESEWIQGGRKHIAS